MPKLLFKYLPLDTIEYLRRVADIIENYRIYWPTRSELNDPMEGIYTRVLMGYAGNTFHGRLEQENPLLKERREKFRILSLSESCFIPQLWAYYAGNYTGICLCYRGDYNFQKAEKVQYKSCEGSPTCFAEEYTEEKIREDLLIKEENWKHEREWRIVEKGIQSFYYYGPEDLVAVILGWTEESEKDNPELEFKRKTIIKYLPENFPVYRVHMGRQSLGCVSKVTNRENYASQRKAAAKWRKARYLQASFSKRIAILRQSLILIKKHSTRCLSL